MSEPDWSALEKERDSYLRKHLRFATDMKIALASIKRRERMQDFLTRRPLADHYKLAEYVADKKRSF